jgi:iron complex transport system substrate-binding protein
MHDQLVGYSIASLGFTGLVAVAARDAEDPTVAIAALGEVPEGFDGLADIGTYAEPDLEAIAALGPDLILGLSYEVDPIYDQLTAIAPTVVIDPPDGERALFALQRSLAVVVGVEDELDERLADYDARLAAAKGRLGSGVEGLAFTVVETYGADENYVVRSPYSPGLQVIRGLGMVPSSTTRDSDEEWTEVSRERLADYDADVIFVQVPAGGEIDPTISRLLANTTAGGADQVFAVSRETWGLEVVEARFAVLDEVERLLGGRELVGSGAFA